jgi:hypothetical protein
VSGFVIRQREYGEDHMLFIVGIIIPLIAVVTIPWSHSQ